MTVLVTALYLRMLEVYHFCAQVTSMLGSGKTKWEYQGNLGLIIDLCREFMTLGSGNILLTTLCASEDQGPHTITQLA